MGPPRRHPKRAGFTVRDPVPGGAQQQLWEQMYDEEYVPGGEKERPVLVSSAEDRTAALQSAEALCVACDGATLSESALTSVLEVTLSACLQSLALAVNP